MLESTTPAGRWRQVQAFVPTPWLLLAWIGWWGWRYAAIQSLAGWRELEGALLAPLGLAQDALLLYAAFTWLRWRSAERAASGLSPAGRWGVELVALALLLSAMLRALDALHCHLLGSHLTVRFWRALGEHLGSWTSGLHTLLLVAFATAFVGRWALHRHVDQGAALLRRLGGPHPRPWLRRQWTAGLLAALAALVAVGLGGLDAGGTAVLPEAHALLSLARAAGIAP